MNKHELAADILTLFRQFLDSDTPEQDELLPGSYIGIVENNDDPERLGRVKVRIHGLHDDIPVDYLPWAPVDQTFVGSRKGSFIIPEIGTVVNVKFQDGDQYFPTVVSKALDSRNFNFDADRQEDYPNTMIFWETAKGDFLKFNRQKSELTLNLANGLFFKVFGNGNITLSNESSNVGNMNLDIRGDFTISNPVGNLNLVTNNVNLSAFGDINLTNNGRCDIKSLEGASLISNGDCDISVAGTAKITAKEMCKVEAMTCEILANDFVIKNAVSPTPLIVDKNNAPIPSDIAKSKEFKVAIGDKISTPILRVESSIFGGPFNAILFDPLTGEPHQGREVVSVSPPTINNVGDPAEYARRLAILNSNRAKEIADATLEITKKYSSLDPAVALMALLPGSVGFDETKKVAEIAAATEAINAKYDSLTSELEASVGNTLATPILGTILKPGTAEFDKNVYNTVKYPLAKTMSDLDITKKTTPEDIIGASGGIVNKEVEL